MNPLVTTNSTATIRLHDTVQQGITDRLIDDLGKLPGSVRNLSVEIDSPGGSVRHGYRLFRAIQAVRAKGVKVTAIITGRAASMGSILAMSADVVRMESSAYLMLHDPSVAVAGNSRALRETAGLLDQVGTELADLYVSKSKLPKNEVAKLMSAETYMSAETALRHGFVDEVFTAAATEHKTLLDRIAAMEGELNSLRKSEAPASAKARLLEQVAQKTAAELSAERRQPAPATPASGPTTTAADYATKQLLMTRADFNSLSPADRLRFSKEGGRLV